MAIQFSNVTLSANGKMKDFLVCGEPADSEDLEGWTAYEDFVSQFPDGTDVHADVDIYLYGGEEIVEATPEEVAYMTLRCARDYRFLSEHCHNIGSSAFDFQTDSPAFGFQNLI